MRCCVNCFIDSEIKAIIEGKNDINDCDYCHQKSVKTYDLDSSNELEVLLTGLIEVYTPKRNLPESFPKPNLSMLKNILCEKWNIFNLQPDVVYSLVVDICKEKYKEQPGLFDEPVGIAEQFQNDYRDKNSIVKNYSWEEFVDEIKNKNRFHTKHINNEILLDYFRLVDHQISAGEVFYRGRICSDKKGFSCKDMGAPPSKLASAGRANPDGIRCLYLANSEKTTLHETRAGLYDFVSIGKFVLKRNIRVINLTLINKISPIIIPDKVSFSINIEILEKISREIAKPLRRSDSFLDYVPTQYISDLIKSKGYDGIMYESTMDKDGINLAIFDEDCFICESVSVFDVNALTYNFSRLKT
jgi:hypothetical protein